MVSCLHLIIFKLFGLSVIDLVVIEEGDSFSVGTLARNKKIKQKTLTKILCSSWLKYL